MTNFLDAMLWEETKFIFLKVHYSYCTDKKTLIHLGLKI